MQVNRASASSMRSGSVRADAASGVTRAQVRGVAPVGGAENELANHPPPSPYPHFIPEAEDAERLLDAIDPKMVYAAAASLLRREGMVGLLLNRNA